MATWKEKREAIRQAVIWALRISELPGVLLANGTTANQHLVAWEGQREANRWTSGIWCNLRLSWVIPRGRDEKRQDWDEDADVLTYRYGGQRHFTVMVMVGSDDQEDMDAIGSATQGLRVLMRHPHVRSILDAADIGLADIRRTIHADYTQHGVRYSQSMTEISFNTFEEFVETLVAPEAPNEIQVPGADYVKRVQTLPEGEGLFETGHDQVDIVRHIDVQDE